MQPGLSAVDVVVDETAVRSDGIDARHRPHRRDARDGPEVCHAASGGRPAATADSTSPAGSRRPRRSGARGAPSTTTRTAGCSARCSTARRRSSRARPSCPAARPRTTPCSSRARTSSTARRPVGAPVALPRGDRRGEGQGRAGLEAFAYRYPERETAYERFFVHRTIFPSDFLADFGFRTVRAGGRVELARLELGGLSPVVEGPREGAASREGGVRAGPGAAGPLSPVGQPTPDDGGGVGVRNEHGGRARAVRANLPDLLVASVEKVSSSSHWTWSSTVRVSARAVSRPVARSSVCNRHNDLPVVRFLYATRVSSERGRGTPRRE